MGTGTHFYIQSSQLLWAAFGSLADFEGTFYLLQMDIRSKSGSVQTSNYLVLKSHFPTQTRRIFLRRMFDVTILEEALPVMRLWFLKKYLSSENGIRILHPPRSAEYMKFL